MSYNLTDAQVESYHRDGYLIIPEFFNREEVSRLYRIAIEDTAMSKNSIDLNDQEGKKTKLALWFTTGNDIYGLLTRSERMVDSVNKLMNGTSRSATFIPN